MKVPSSTFTVFACLLGGSGLISLLPMLAKVGSQPIPMYSITATSTPFSTPTRTVSTSTPTPPLFSTPTPVPGNVIVDPSFETIPVTGWTLFPTSGHAFVNQHHPHSGAYSAELCVVDLCTEYIEQPVTVPATGILTYYWYMVSSDDTLTPYDFLKVELYNTNNGLLATLRVWDNIDTRNTWSLDTLYLNPYAGQTVKVRFTVTTDESEHTTFYIDDVNLAPGMITATPIWTPTRTPIWTSTAIIPTWMPTISPTVQPNIIANPGFESGPGVGWAESSSGGYELISTDLSHTGAYSAHLCGYNGCQDYIQQQVSIPVTASLKYWWLMSSDEGTTQAHDFLRVQLYGGDGRLIATLRTRSNTSRRNTWARDVIDLSNFAGRTVMLRFSATTNASLPTSFYIDDVSLP